MDADGCSHAVLGCGSSGDYLDVMIVDFNKMVEELGSIETLKTDFISNVSHEMKTPIAVIKNSAQMLQLGTLPEEEKAEYAKNIDSAAGRLSNLITNILKLNKLENQRIVPEAKSYDVCRQLCECALSFENLWEKKEIELEMIIEDAAMIQADESLLQLVWNNLFSNAIKFTEPGGRIIIREVSDEEYVKVSVSDTGCGMSQESMKHILDKFYQGDSSHSTEGNGLGLALVKRVLELMDGEIQIDSSMASFLLDGYESFGWEMDQNLPEHYKTDRVPNQNKVVLHLKRNRKIINKMELTRLQRNFEACVSEIEALEKSKTSAALMCALFSGMIGTAFMAGSTFAVTGQPPHIILCILLSIPGFVGWILPYFLYRRIVGKQTEKLMPLIEKKYDEIYAICEKGNKLLNMENLK